MWKPSVPILFLFACGDDAQNAPQPDAPADSSIPSGEALACTPRGAPGSITVEGPSGSAALQVTVVVHDPAGAIVSRKAVTGSNASVVVDAPSCGMVSVHALDPGTPGDDPDILTWGNVQPGDHLIHFANRTDFVEREIQLDIGAFPDATSYDVMAVCPGYTVPLGERGQVGPMVATARCLPDAQSISVLVVANTPTGAGFAVVAEAPLAASGPTVVPLPPYAASAQTVTATVQHAEAFAGGDGSFGLFAVPAPDRSLLLGFRLSKLATAMPSFGSIPIAAGAGGSAFVTLRSPIGAAVDRLNSVSRPHAAFPAAIALDLDTDFLPAVDGSVDADAARPSVTWTTARQLTADLAMVDLELPMGGSKEIYWRFVTPARTGTARFPELPAELWPAGTPRLQGVTAFDLSTITSYDEARNQLGGLFAPATASAEVRSSGSFYRAP